MVAWARQSAGGYLLLSAGRTLTVGSFLVAASTLTCGGEAYEGISPDAGPLDSGSRETGAGTDSPSAPIVDSSSPPQDGTASADADRPDVPVDSGAVTVLAYGVISADYSRALDRMVLLGTDSALHLLDPHTMADSPVPVGGASYVTVSPDGIHAAVVLGAASAIAYYDLSSESLVASYSVAPLQPVSATFGSANILYVFPEQAQSTVAAQLNIATGSVLQLEIPYELIAPFTRGVLTPDGTTLFAMDKPCRELGDFNLQDGGIVDVAGTSLQSACCGLWLSPDASRLFDGCGRVFSGSPPEGTGSLSGTGWVVSMDFYSGAANTIAVLAAPVSSGVPTQIQTYDIQSLALLGASTLPTIPLGGQAADAFGLYVFHDAAGTHTFAIVATPVSAESDPTQLTYAIASL
jgi:chitinase